MAKTVVGLYNQIEDARDSVQDLVENGFHKENINLIALDPEKRLAQEFSLDPGIADQKEAVSTGAGIGAVLGGIGGLLVGIGTFLIPGIGPVLAAGPLITTLAGAGIGAAAGGLVGSLTGAGVPENDAGIFAEGVRRGGTLVMIYTEDQAAERAADILNRHKPVDIEKQTTGRKDQRWNGFAESHEQFAFDRTDEPYHDRAASSTLDYGPGARTYLAGQPVSDYDRSSADLSNYQNSPTGDWLMVESSFKENFERRFVGSEKKWEDYRESYRFGFDRARQGAYSNAEWDDILTQVRQHWERDYPNRRWEDYVDEIHEGWLLGRVPR